MVDVWTLQEWIHIVVSVCYIPVVAAVILIVLSTNEWFLHTSLGEYIFAEWDFYDVNQTAIAFDSTGPSDRKAQVAEVFTKKIVGYAFPSKNAGEQKEGDIFIFADGKQLPLFPSYMSDVWEPYCTYYEFLQQKLNYDKQQVKEYASLFLENHQHPISNFDLNLFANKYTEAMQGFCPAFQKLFKLRNAYMSFHTFGNGRQIA